jgi:hypothetical protein
MVSKGYRPSKKSTRTAIAQALGCDESKLWIPVSEEQFRQIIKEGTEQSCKK